MDAPTPKKQLSVINAYLTATRLECVDGLRGIAVLLVLSEHVRDYWQIAADKTLGQSGIGWIDWFHRIGMHGVDLFFVISGFCLSRPIFDSIKRRGSYTFDIPRFVAARVSRILPPYLAALFICSWFIGGAKKIGLPQPLGLSRVPPTIASVFQQSVLLDPTTELVQKAFWTLYVESRWYLVFPIVIWLFLKHVHQRKLIAVVLSLVSLAYLLVDGGSAFLGALPSFLGGMIVAYAYSSSLKVAKKSLIFVLATCVALISLVGPDAQYQTLLWSIASVSILFVSLESRRVRFIASSSVLRLVGFASYSLYLMDNVFGSNAAEALHGHLPVAAVVVCSIVAAIAGGFAFWILIEKPTQTDRVRNLVATSIVYLFDKASNAVNRPLDFVLNDSPG